MLSRPSCSPTRSAADTRDALLVDRGAGHSSVAIAIAPATAGARRKAIAPSAGPAGSSPRGYLSRRVPRRRWDHAGARARRRYARPLLLGGCAWGESGWPSPTRRKPGAELAVPGLWRPSTARPWRVACSGWGSEVRAGVCTEAVEPCANRPTREGDLPTAVAGRRSREGDAVDGRPAEFDPGSRGGVASDRLSLL
jgi:hypothetical protein